MRKSYIGFTVVLLALAAQFLYFYPQLQERVAIHFDGAGHPNGWASKPAYAGMQAFIAVVFALSFVGLPRLLVKLPDNLWSLPNRDYWLAEERREATMGFVTDMLAWMGTLGLTLIVTVNQLCMLQNLTGNPAYTAMPVWILLIAFFGLTLAWTGWFIVYFLRVPKGGDA